MCNVKVQMTNAKPNPNTPMTELFLEAFELWI